VQLFWLQVHDRATQHPALCSSGKQLHLSLHPACLVIDASPHYVKLAVFCMVTIWHIFHTHAGHNLLDSAILAANAALWDVKLHPIT
jgi:hypothetical protein